MRCFFHLVGPDGEFIPDEHGADVTSVEEARTEALKAVAELRREEPEVQQDWNGWTLRVVSAHGELLSKIQLNTVSYPISGSVGLVERDHYRSSPRGKRKQHLLAVISYSPLAIHWANLPTAVAQVWA